jgi:hypothetical protein
VAGIWSSRMMAALTALFNVLTLNLMLLIASLPVITLPAAVRAASVALDRWRRDGEDRVAREFLLALRTGPRARTTVTLGVPLAAVALGMAEAQHFARAAGPSGRAALGLCLAALLITVTALGYLIQLTSDEAAGPASSPADTWSQAVGLALRNLLVTGPLAAAEVAGAVTLTVIDPGLLLLGLPLALLHLTKLTAGLGLRRATRYAAARDSPKWYSNQ